MYKKVIKLGELTIAFESYIEFEAGKHLDHFLSDTSQIDLLIPIHQMPEDYHFPTNKIGSDLILDYYLENNLHYAIAKPGSKRPATIVEYNNDFTKLTMYLNEIDFPRMIRSIDKLLQLFPIREFMLMHHYFLFHSSRIEVNGKAILFTGPSGMGKTTQATLWKQYENSLIVGNDRTLFHIDQSITTYGYIVDGSEPIAINYPLPLGAIVILRQAKRNAIVPIKPVKKLRYLFEQTVFDLWNSTEVEVIQKMWIDLLSNYPVYLLECDISKEAVECLKQQLIQDGVI